MRAAVLTDRTRPPEPQEVDEPSAVQDGQALVAVEAAGINPIDLALASGTFYGGATPIGSVVGREGVGRREDTGERVYFDAPVSPAGAIAERVVIDTRTAIPVPDGVEPGLACALGIAGLAAWLPLEWRAELEPGETVLVLGASGIVGAIAVQAARLLGAGRVVGAARNLAAVPPQADNLVDLSDDTDLVARMKDACGGEGPDVVIDPVWGAPAQAAIAAAKFRARVVNIGRSAGETATIPSADVRGKLLAILGHTNFAAPQDVRHSAYTRMAEHAARGDLTVPVEGFALDRIGEAWTQQAASPNRKLVIEP